MAGFYLVLIFSLCSLLLGIEFFGVCFDRHLQGDTASYIFNILQLHQLPFGWLRPVSNLLYLPTYSIAAVAGLSEITWLAVFLTGFALLLQYALSFYFCWRLLPGSKKYFIVFPVINFAAGTVQALILTGLQNHEVSSFFWPAVFLLGFHDLKKTNLWLFAGFILALSTTHESAIFQLAELFLLAALLKKKEWLLPLALGMIGCVLRASLGNYPTSQEYLGLSPLIADPFSIWQWLVVFAFCTSQIPRVGLKALLLVAPAILVGAPLSLPSHLALDRIPETAVLTLLGLVFVSAVTFELKPNIRALKFFTAIALMCAVLRESALTSVWLAERFQILQKLSETSASCENYHSDHPLYPIHFASVLMGKSREVRKILVPEYQTTACQTLKAQNKIYTYDQSGNVVHEMIFDPQYYFWSNTTAN